MGQRSRDLAGSGEAFAARWQGLLDCTCSPCRQRSVCKNVVLGCVCFFSHSYFFIMSPVPGLWHVRRGYEIPNYILPVSPSRHPRHHNQSNLTALLGARAVPMASLYRWENQVIQLLLDPPQSHAKCQPPSASPNNPLPAPSVGHHLPCGVSIPPQARRVLEKQLPAAVPVCDPPPRVSAGLWQEVPNAGAGGKTPSGDRQFFGRAVPRQPSCGYPTHTHTVQP